MTVHGLAQGEWCNAAARVHTQQRQAPRPGSPPAAEWWHAVPAHVVWISRLVLLHVPSDGLGCPLQLVICHPDQCRAAGLQEPNKAAMCRQRRLVRQRGQRRLSSINLATGPRAAVCLALRGRGGSRVARRGTLLLPALPRLNRLRQLPDGNTVFVVAESKFCRLLGAACVCWRV